MYVAVPFMFHRFIIGPQGQEIRTLADKYGVSVEVPPLERQESKITLHGPVQNCDDARQALERRVLELEAEKEERVSAYVWNFSFYIYLGSILGDLYHNDVIMF